MKNEKVKWEANQFLFSFPCSCVGMHIIKIQQDSWKFKGVPLPAPFLICHELFILSENSSLLKFAGIAVG